MSIQPITPVAPIRAAREYRSFMTSMPRPIPEEAAIGIVLFGLPMSFYTDSTSGSIHMREPFVGHAIEMCAHADCSNTVLVRFPMIRDAVALLAVHEADGEHDSNIYCVCTSHSDDGSRISVNEEYAVVGHTALRDLLQEMLSWSYFNEYETNDGDVGSYAPFTFPSYIQEVADHD